MKLFSSLHDPKRARYAIYYSTVLVVVIATTLLLISGKVELTIVEGTMVFVEGFVALFMLARHEKVISTFPNHLKQIKNFFKQFGAVILIVGILFVETISGLVGKIHSLSKS